jgi:lysophospholipase
MVLQVHSLSSRDEFAVYPNPFYNYNSTTGVPNSANAVWTQQELRLVDGGEALQNNPIWPFLQPARGVDVMIVNDNSADSNNFPNGSEILTTYVQSQSHNLTRMPYIPSVDTFISQGLNTRATFFGCNDTDKVTIVYVPNVNITYQSNTPTAKLQYSVAETEGMIGNGVAVANQGGEQGWATCLGCAIMMKTGTTLPTECQACFQKHCYYQ